MEITLPQLLSLMLDNAAAADPRIRGELTGAVQRILMGISAADGPVRGRPKKLLADRGAWGNGQEPVRRRRRRRRRRHKDAVTKFVHQEKSKRKRSFTKADRMKRHEARLAELRLLPLLFSSEDIEKALGLKGHARSRWTGAMSNAGCIAKVSNKPGQYKQLKKEG